MKKIIQFFVILSVLVIPFNLYSQKLPKPVKTKLLIDNSDIEENNSFKIGVLFDIDPGWHIYWKNPGNSGLPIRIDFKLPTNFEQSELRWPYPKSFKSGIGTDYGYEDKVLIWSDVKLPENFNINTKIPISADINWLNCKEICIPGKNNFEQKIVLTEKNENKNIFDNWKKLIPQKSIKGLTYISNSKKLEDGSLKFNIEIESAKEIEDIELFPVTLEELEIKEINYSKISRNKYKVSLTTQIYKGQELSSEFMESVLIVKNIDDPAKSLDILLEIGT